MKLTDETDVKDPAIYSYAVYLTTCAVVFFVPLLLVAHKRLAQVFSIRILSVALVVFFATFIFWRIGSKYRLSYPLLCLLETIGFFLTWAMCIFIDNPGRSFADLERLISYGLLALIYGLFVFIISFPFQIMFYELKRYLADRSILK